MTTKSQKKVEVRTNQNYTLGCMTANGILICYCGKCKQEDYALPTDFPLKAPSKRKKI